MLTLLSLPGKKQSFYGTSASSRNPDVIDIDSDNNDPQLCSLYAMEIYRNLRVAEVLKEIKFLQLIFDIILSYITSACIAQT